MKTIFALFNITQKKRLAPGVGKTVPYLGKGGPSPFLPQTVPWFTIATYFQANDVDYHIYRNAIVNTILHNSELKFKLRFDLSSIETSRYLHLLSLTFFEKFAIEK